MTRRIRIRWVILILVLGTVGGVIWYYTRPEPVEVMVKAVEHGTVERTFDGNGTRLQPPR